jgi:hypothetical protein
MQQNQNEKLISLYFEMYPKLLTVTIVGNVATIFIRNLYRLSYLINTVLCERRAQTPCDPRRIIQQPSSQDDRSNFIKLGEQLPEAD